MLGPIGASFGLLGASWSLLGASWGLLEASWSGRLGFSVRGPPLGPSWGCLGALLDRLEGLLGRLEALLGGLGALLGASWAVLGAILGASWAVLERQDDEKVRKPKASKNPKEINGFGLLGPSWEGSWGSLGTSWRQAVLRPSWASWADCSATRGPLGPSWGPLGALLARLGVLLAPKMSCEKMRGAPGGTRQAPGDL